MRFKVSIVIPAYNEESNIRMMVQEISIHLKDVEHQIIFVDDGSSDGTLAAIKEVARKDRYVQYVSLSRNFGHQNALRAGLDHAVGDAVILMDSDLQHPPSLLPKMIALWRDHGRDVVYTIRQENLHVSFLKKLTAALFYRLINMISEVPINPNAADFVLIDRKVADILRSCNEKPLFLRGMVAWVGFTQEGLSYEPNPRFGGKTKYSFKRMIEFAIDGVTAMSVRPLRFSMFVGILTLSLLFIYFIYLFYDIFISHQEVIGWVSIVACVLFIGGVQLVMLGIIGEYLGKLFMQSKERPSYIVKECS